MPLSRAVEIFNRSLRPFDIAIVRRSRFLDRFKTADTNSHDVDVPPLPACAQEYLRDDHPQLIEYKRRYEGHPAARHSVWKPEYRERELNLSAFRADNAYLWQSRDVTFDVRISYALSTYYVKNIDELGLMKELNEDGSFGAVTFKMDDGKTVSRDLLDSIWEINFLERHLKLSTMVSVSVLDVGAGYGRLAYRLAKSLSNLKIVLCTDAVPESTFICEYYLKHTGVSDRAKTVPLDTIEEALHIHPMDIAINIHSFQECSFESISWWIDVISRRGVKYLMLAHYKDELLSSEPDGTKRDFRPLLERQGFELLAQESVYARGTLARIYGLYPERWYFLFRNKIFES